MKYNFLYKNNIASFIEKYKVNGSTITIYIADGNSYEIENNAENLQIINERMNAQFSNSPIYKEFGNLSGRIIQERKETLKEKMERKIFSYRNVLIFLLGIMLLTLGVVEALSILTVLGISVITAGIIQNAFVAFKYLKDKNTYDDYYKNYCLYQAIKNNNSAIRNLNSMDKTYLHTLSHQAQDYLEKRNEETSSLNDANYLSCEDIEKITNNPFSNPFTRSRKK